MSSNLEIKLEQAKIDRNKLIAEVKRLKKKIRESKKPEYQWKHGDTAVNKFGNIRVFIVVDGVLEVFRFSGVLDGGWGGLVQNRAIYLGYRKTGNIFEH